jgi:hypothetical protein
LLALALQPVADDLLGATLRVVPAAQGIDVGGVEEVHAAGRRRVEDGVALRRVALQAERHGAEAEPGDAQAGAAEFHVLHDRSYPCTHLCERGTTVMTKRI